MNGITGPMTPGAYSLSRIINTYNSNLEKSLESIATGLKIKRPSDDISAYFKAQELNKLATYSANASKGLEEHLMRLQTAEAALGSISKLMDKMEELAREASEEDNAQVRGNLGKEYDELRVQITNMVNTTRYKGELLLTGNFDPDAIVNGETGAGISYQISENPGDWVSYSLLDTRFALDSDSDGANVYHGLNLSTDSMAEAWSQDNGKAQAQEAVEKFTEQDSGQVRLKRNVARLNTNITVITSAKNNLDSKQSNYLAASSAYTGVDQALETSRYTSLQIKQQAAASFLAQSNISYTNVMGLLTGFNRARY